MRRSTFTDQPVSYGAIGGSTLPDLVSFPPKGYRASEYSSRLGSGAERFATASASLMTWGVQRGSGIRVLDVQPGAGVHYHGLLFQPNGAPLAQQPAQYLEERFAADGTPYITPGITAMLKYRRGLTSIKAHVRVVLVVDEPNRAGFVLGTLSRNPASGEAFFVVERRDDDTVWMTYRVFERPQGFWRTLTAPRWHARQRRAALKYLRVLHPSAAA